MTTEAQGRNAQRLLFDDPALKRPHDDVDDLKLLASTMIEVEEDARAFAAPRFPNGNWNVFDNPEIWAGYTYLGQFIGHDVTFDPMSPAAQASGLGPWSRTRVGFNLDSLYGPGPDQAPSLYDAAALSLGTGTDGKSDVLREATGRARIPEMRNDENAIVAQIHLAFMKYHNRVVAEIGGPFEKASDIVRKHYQWIVLHDFLPRVVGYRTLREVLDDGRYPVVGGIAGSEAYRQRHSLRFEPQRDFLPLEFSAAALRFGHSMVRPRYVVNEHTKEGFPIFHVSASGDDGIEDLRGSRHLSMARRIDWSRFFPLHPRSARRADGPTNGFEVARALDTMLSSPLGHVSVGIGPGAATRSLAELNLLRGNDLGLASGQAIATKMGVPAAEIIRLDSVPHRFRIGPSPSAARPDRSAVRLSAKDKQCLEQLFGNATPLWYYVLKEAELLRGGRALGPVGGRIVAEVSVAVLRADPQSILNQTWTPTPGRFGCRRQRYFTMADLIRYVEQ
jgi:hypothetical protein